MIKGKLFIIGGAEDKGGPEDSRRSSDYYENGILKRVIEESKHGINSRIEILTTASKVPKEIGADYKKAFARLDASNTGIIPIENR